MNKLQSFAFKPTSAALGENPPTEGDLIMEGVEHPATPMPQQISLSELMSNTPTRQGSSQEVSPEEKVVWKLSAKKTPAKPIASQESPSAKLTTLLKFLNEDESKKKVAFLSCYCADVDGDTDCQRKKSTCLAADNARERLTLDSIDSKTSTSITGSVTIIETLCIVRKQFINVRTAAKTTDSVVRHCPSKTDVIVT